MPDERADDGKARALGNLLHRGTQVAQSFSIVQLLNAFVKGALGDLHQAASLLAHPPDTNGQRSVTIKAVIEDPEVQSNDVAFAQRSVRRNSVNDLFVDRYAQAAGKDASGHLVS